MHDDVSPALVTLIEDTIERTVSQPVRLLTDAIHQRLGGVGGDQLRGLGPWGYAGNPDQPFGPITYSQFGEDLILINLLHIQGIKTPRFLDIGAHHPINCNNTALMYSRGARGINIDANPNMTALYADLRPEDVTLTIGVGPEESVLDYYMVDNGSGRNTFDRETAEAFVASDPEFSIREIRKVPVVTLDTIVDKYFDGDWPDLLCLDAEGLDRPILDASRFRAGAGPRAICVEVLSGNERDDEVGLVALLNQRGYVSTIRTLGNSIFVEA